MTDVHLSEATASFMKMMVLQRGKDGKRSRMRDLLNTNLAEAVRANIPGAKKFKAFFRGMREFFGLNLSRSVAIQQAVREGKLDQEAIDEFAAKFYGSTAQLEYEAEVRKEAASFAQVAEAFQVDDYSSLPDTLGSEGFASNVDLDKLADSEAWDPVGLYARTAEDIFRVNAALRNPNYESFRILVLDDSDVVQHAEVASVGSINSTRATPDMIARAIRAANANGGTHSKVVISHNHPSGNPQPSPEDYAITKQFRDVAEQIGVELVDHVITNGTMGYSFTRKQTFDMEEGVDTAWSIIDRRKLPTVSQQSVAGVAAAFRAKNPAASYAVLMNVRMKLVGIAHLPSNLDEASKRLAETAKASGAANYAFLQGLNKGTDPILASILAWGQNTCLGTDQILALGHRFVGIASTCWRSGRTSAKGR